MDGLKIEPLQSLQSKEQAALLDTVDELRRHGVNRYVSLPQLIVCGDQSSSQSSVLEAISGVQFPVNDGLCTRFTTEVILRRAAKSLATVKLIPSKDAPPSHKEKLSLFEKTSINHAEIPDLISEAKTFMGLTGSSSFSRDVLQLEVSGPKLPHLTLVDLPGLIHHPNKEQTEEDVRIPKELVKKYMSQARSIVLAIITAKNDTSNQVVLEMAKAADPQGNRTMGIITKPDCLIRDSPNESNFFALASNKETYFKLDWHVLRNGDFNERKDSTFDRDEVEKDFFSSTIWNNLPSHKRGVEALRTRLSHVLYQQIQKELPSLLKEIELELKACKTTLDRLGSPRDTPASRRQYLSDVAKRFNDLIRAGIDGIYQDPFFRSGTSGILGSVQMQKTRLRANVRKAEQSFLDRMHQYGHSYVIVSEEGSQPQSGITQKAQRSIGSKDDQTIIHEQNFLKEIRALLNMSKGRELPGTFTPLLVGDLFIRQSKNWKPFAMDFVEDVWNIVKQFLDDVLAHVVDESVREALLDEIIDPAMDNTLVKLKDKVIELHSPYARGYPATLNPRFVKELENRRSQQAANPPVQPSSLFPNPDTEDADAHACRELLHLMQAYYAVALDVFVDNVSSLAVENCLMSALESLLSVSEMSDEELEDIAFESQEVRELRSQTLEKQSSLQKSFDLCRRQARKLASNRLNDEARKEAQNIESVPVSLTNGVERVNISEPVSTTPVKSAVSSSTKPQQSGQSPWGQSGSATSATWGQNAAKTSSSSLFSTPSPGTAQNAPVSSPFSSKASGPSPFAALNSGGLQPSSLGTFGSSNLAVPVGTANPSANGASLFGSKPPGGLFGQTGSSQLQSNPVGKTASSQASTEPKNKKETVDFSYFKDIPTSSRISSGAPFAVGWYAHEEEIGVSLFYEHISTGRQPAPPSLTTEACKYSAEEIRLKDYYTPGVPVKVHASYLLFSDSLKIVYTSLCPQDSRVLTGRKAHLASTQAQSNGISHQHQHAPGDLCTYTSMTISNNLSNTGTTEIDPTNARRRRRWAPKVRTGCLTCKIRRIKCDETKPSCKKCTSTGRKCDGYKDNTIDTQSIGSSRNPEALVPAAAPTYSVSWLPFYGGELQKRNFDFFQLVTSSALSSFYGSQFWAQETLRVAHHYPALFHAITAFGSIHHGYLSDTTPSDVPRAGIYNGIEFGLQEFNRAIKSMSTLMTQKELSAQDQQAILTTCILFTCLSSLQGRQSQAFMHVRNGLRMIHHWRLNSRVITPEENNAVDMLLLTFVQLDTQIRPYVVGQESLLQWTEEGIVAALSPLRIFQTVFEAYFDLEIFFNKLSRLKFNAYSFEELSMEIHLLNRQVDIWDRQFIQLLSTITPNASELDALHFIRLRREYARAILSCLVINAEEDVHDKLILIYQELLDLARKVLQKDSYALGHGARNTEKIDHPVFVLGSGVVEPLFFTATRCREPVLRRQALHLLRQCPRREGICEGMMGARIVQNIIELEEQGCQRFIDWHKRRSPSPTTTTPSQTTSPSPQFLPFRGVSNPSTENNFWATSESMNVFMNHIDISKSSGIGETKTARSATPTEKSQCSEKGKWVCEKHRVVETQFLLYTERQVKIVIWTGEDRELNRNGREMVLTWW